MLDGNPLRRVLRRIVEALGDAVQRFRARFGVGSREDPNDQGTVGAFRPEGVRLSDAGWRQLQTVSSGYYQAVWISGN